MTTSVDWQEIITKELQQYIKYEPEKISRQLTCYEYVAIHVCLNAAEKQAAWLFTKDMVASLENGLTPVVALANLGNWRFVVLGYFARGEIVPMCSAGVMSPAEAVEWRWTHEMGIEAFTECLKDRVEAEKSVWSYAGGGE